MPSQARLDRLYNVLEAQQLDAVAIIPGSNFRYLTNSVHYLMERPLVLFIPSSGRPTAVIPILEVDLFESKGFDADIIAWADAEGYEDAFAKASSQLGLSGKRIGLEGQLIRFFEAEAIRKHAPSAELVDAHHAISSIRLQKEPSEIDSLRQAIKTSEQALENTLAEIKVGMTEREIASILINYMNELGGQGLSFDPIVLAADNSARPHGKIRDDYAIQAGDALLFDFGTSYNGYPADITRTVFVGEPSDEARALYEVVLKANETGRNAVKPGVTAGSVDDQVTQSMKNAGYSEYILHRTGHGLGLDVHEAPYITSGNEQALQPGMVFTIEPGLYKQGALGVRIEDNVVVTDTGAESLTTITRELRVVG